MKLRFIILTLFTVFLSLQLSCAGTSAKCGNNKIEGNEECDDGNNISGDGCSSKCLLESYCGNGVCEDGETHSCPTDCAVCGNGICDDTESVSSCTVDCYCTNGTCDNGEDVAICPADCQNVYECGNSVCESAESISSCPSDCYCTNGTCDQGETEVTCPQDCAESACGNGTCESSESITLCSQDCYCGNSTCDNGETASSCPSDCAVSRDCGNGLIDSGEACDGNNLAGNTCLGLGFDGGTLSCNADCTLNTSQCTNNTQCTIVPQSGCSVNEKCTVDTSTTTRCIDAGSGGEMSPCSADADCGAGLSCATVNAFTNEGACRRFCRDATQAYDSLDCSGSAGSACYYAVGDVNGNVVPNLHLCTAPCDPLNNTGCISSMKCNIYRLDRNNDGITDSYMTECYARQDSNYYCSGTQVCPDGYECFDFGFGKQCYHWCTDHTDPCPSLGLACYSFPGEHAVIGGIEYGYCDVAQ